jgi:hypothetical protein
VDDVLLAELAPDGVALDAMAGFDVRHGERGVAIAWPLKNACNQFDYIEVCAAADAAAAFLHVCAEAVHAHTVMF